MGKKKNRGATEPTTARFEEKGIDPNEPVAALEKLAPDWGAEPELEAWAVRGASARDEGDLGARLHDLLLRTRDKDVRRELKRALFRLEQHGRWTPPASSGPPATRTLLGSGEDLPLAWLSAIDATGTRLVWMARTTAGGVATLSAVTSEDRGLLELHSGKTTRKALREAQREISERSGIRLVEAPWEWAHHLLRQAQERTERGRFPEASRLLRGLVPEPPPTAPTAPIDGLVDRATVESDEAALAGSASLLDEPEVGTWLLPLPWIQGTLEKLTEADSSVVVVSPAAKEERMREAFEEAVRSVLDDGERRERFGGRLEETAYLLAKRGRDAAARAALAAAIAARSGRAIDEIPVLAEITRRSLALGLRAHVARESEREKSSLVVTPQQARAEQARSRRRP